MAASDTAVDALMHAHRAGDVDALPRLIPLLYDELRRIARDRLVRERDDHTLQPTELVHEAFFKLVSAKGIDWEGRAHFFAVASRAMRQVGGVGGARGLREVRGRSFLLRMNPRHELARLGPGASVPHGPGPSSVRRDRPRERTAPRLLLGSSAISNPA